MPRHVINMQPDTYAFDDQPLIHEGIWKAASTIANAPMQMAQLRMQEEDRAQVQEDRRIGLADRDRAFNASVAEREYQHGKDKHALQKEKQDWIRNRAKDLSPNKDRPNTGAYAQAIKDWAEINGEAPVAPTSAHVDPSAQQVPAPTQQDSSDADVLRASLKALGGSPTYTPSPLRPTQMTTGATGTPSRFGPAVQGLPQDSEWTGKPMPQIARSGTSPAVQGLPQDNEWTGKPMPQIARSGTSPAAPVNPHRIVMGVDIDEPAPPMGGLVDRQMDMADIPEEFKIRDGAAPLLANNSPAARPQNLGLPVSHTPEGVAPSYNNNAPGVQLMMDPGYSAPTDMAGEQRQAFTNIVNDVRTRADPSGTTYGAGFGYTPVKQQPETQTLQQYFNNYRPTEADTQSADVRGLRQDAPGVQLVMDPGYSAPTDMAGEQRQSFTNIGNDARMRADPSGTTYGAGFGYTPVEQQPETQTLRQYFNNYMPTEADLQSADVRGLQQDAARNAAAQATLGGDRVNQKIYMDPISIPFRFRNPITRPPVQAIAPPQIPDMYQIRGLSRGQ